MELIQLNPVNSILLAISIIIITLTGFLYLSISSKLILSLNKMLILPLSWLSGCLVISISYLILLLLSFIGLPVTVFSIIALPLLGIVIAIKFIYANIIEFLKLYKSSLETKDTRTELNKALEIFLTSIIFVIIIFVLTLNSVKPSWAWDSWMIWSFKAKMLYFDLITPEFFYNNSYSFSHQDYPLLVPFVQAFISKFVGIYDERCHQIFFSLSYLSFIVILYAFIKEYLDKLLSLILIIPFICLPVLLINFIAGYADGILACYHLVTIIFLYKYIKTENADWENMIPVGIGVAGMLMTKNDGTLLSLSVLVISILYIVLYNNKNLKQIMTIIITFISALMINLPWIIYTKINGVSNDVISLSNVEGLNWISGLLKIPVIISYLVLDNMLRPDLWGVLFYVLIMLVVFNLMNKKKEKLVFFIGCFLINCTGLVIVYVLSPHDLISHMASSSDRVIMALLPLLFCYIVTTLGFNKEITIREYTDDEELEEIQEI